jgi:hypothetical protein
MTTLEIHVNRARRRLWLNRWLRQLGWTLAGGWGLLAVVVIVERLCHLGIPLVYSALALTAFAVISAIVWLSASAEDQMASAVALDQAAGLRERVTSGLYCAGQDEPFARSVYGDAVRTVEHISIGGHLPVRYPRSFNWAGCSAAVALLLTWIMPSYDLLGLLAKQRRQEEKRQVLKTTQATVQQTVDRVQQIAKNHDSLKDAAGLQDLAELKPADSSDPEELKREAVKRLDRLSDRLKQQRESAQYEELSELKKMFSRLTTDARAESPVAKLQQGLAKGDFKAASEAVKAMQEQLAKAKNEDNKAQVAEMQKKLAELAKQMEKLAGQERLKDLLERSGLKEKDVKDLLEQLSKKDLQSVKQDLEKKGLDPQQIEKLMKQLAKSKDACSKCKGLAGALSSAAKKMSESGDRESGDAQAALSDAGEQLSEMEALQQQMNDLEATMSELASCKEGLGQGNKPGEGEGALGEENEGPGGGMGQLGQGMGGTAPRQETSVKLTQERVKGQQSPGKVISELYIDGEQLKGDAKAERAEAAAAAERQATEALDRDRIPLQYRKPVKRYFSDIQIPPPTSKPSGKP